MWSTSSVRHGAWLDDDHAHIGLKFLSQGLRPAIDSPLRRRVGGVAGAGGSAGDRRDAQRRGMGILTYSPLAGGWLSGRWTADATPTSPARQRLVARFDMSLPENQRKLEATKALAQLADDSGISLIQLAIAFVINHPAVTSAIIGPRTMEQLEKSATRRGRDTLPGAARSHRQDRPPRRQPSTLRTRATANMSSSRRCDGADQPSGGKSDPGSRGLLMRFAQFAGRPADRPDFEADPALNPAEVRGSRARWRPAGRVLAGRSCGPDESRLMPRGAW
jgi:hypothetical protein